MSAALDRNWQDRFQQAALDPSQWLGVLQEVADATGSARGQLIGVGGVNAIPFNWVNSFSDAALEDFTRFDGGSHTINFRIAADLDPASGSIVHEEDYRRVRRHLRDDTYLDFCRDNDILLGCHTQLILDSGTMVGLAMLRAHADGVSTRAQREEFARAAEAARAAVRLQRAIEHQGVKLVGGTLEAMSIDCILIDGLGSVCAMNAGAERIIAAAAPLRLKEGRLTSSIPDLARRIDLAIRDVLQGAPHIRLKLDAGRRLDFFRMARREWAMSFAPAAILVIRDASAQLSAETEIVTQTYGLSRAETEIAVMLARGMEREQIAAARDVSILTLRTQIRNLYDKTGCRRESELVALLAGLIE